jgi:hypothetical protein
MKKLLPRIQPYLLAIAPLAALFRNNSGEIFLFDFIILLVLIAIAISFLFYSIRAWTKDEEKTSIALCLLCFSLIASAELSVSKSLIWSLCAGSALLSLMFSIPHKWKTALAGYLSIPLLVVVCFNLLEVGNAKRTIQIEITQRNSVPLPNKENPETCSRDIYIIILDEFISELAFRDYYRFDNSRFFNYLKKKGFHLVSSSTSNYPWTITSIASIMNFDYHSTRLSKTVFTGAAQRFIEQNRLFGILKQEGYAIHHIPSIYWMGNPHQNPFSDCLFRTKSYGLLQAVSQMTPWKNVYRTYQRNSHSKHVLSQLKQLKLISLLPGKKMAFAHIMCPHRPIAFAEDGSILSEKELVEAEKDPQHRYYLGQAKFISQEAMKTVDYILEHSSEPPIIILLSDHGRFPIGCSSKGKATIPLDQIAWRFSNLQALYLPDFDQPFPDRITPLNTIRTILNHYFGYALPILEDACCPHFLDLSQRVSSQTILQQLSPQKNEEAVRSMFGINRTHSD